MRPTVLITLLAFCVLQALPCSWAHAIGVEQGAAEMHLVAHQDEPATLPEPDAEGTSGTNPAEWAESHPYHNLSDWQCHAQGLRRLGFFDAGLTYRFDPGLAVERPPRA